MKMREEKNLSAVVEESVNETKVPMIFQVFAELALGILMLVYHDNTAKVIMIIIGSLMVGYGVFELIAFATNNRPYSFRRGLTSGVLITILGVSFIVQAEQLKDILAIIIGALVVLESVVNMRRALMIKHFEYDKWSALFIGSVVLLILGAFICIYPDLFSSAVSIIMGISMILIAIIDGIAIALISVNRQKVKRKYNIKEPDSTEVVITDKK